MSLVGMGRAFNLRFMPNGPLRTNCYHRPMPQIGMFGGGGNFSYTENVNIQNGPSGFWGFLTGLTQGFFGGGMFGMGMGGGIFGLLNSRQAAVPQGTGDQKNPDLDNLNAFFGGKGYVIRQEKDGTYTAAKDGKIVASGKYDDVKAKLSELADGTTADEAKDTPEAKAKVHVPKLEKDENGKWKDANGNEYTWDSDNKCFHKVQASGTEGGGKTEAQLQQEAAAAHDPKLELKNGKWVDSSGKEYEWKDGKFEPKTSTDTDEVDTSHQGGGTRRTGGSHGSASPAGWYRASNDKSSAVNNTHNRDGSGKTAQQITSAILSTKLKGVLNAQQQKELCSIIIQKNPSVFDSNGNPKANADYTKLDVPSMKWIEDHFGIKHGSKVPKQKDVYASKADEVKDKKPAQKTKLGISWEITPAYMGHARSKGSVTVQINGKQVRLTAFSNVPRSVADAKAEIARDLEQQLKDRGVGDKYTVY